MRPFCSKGLVKSQSARKAIAKALGNAPLIWLAVHCRTAYQVPFYTFKGRGQKRKKWLYTALSLALGAGTGITYSFINRPETGSDLNGEKFVPFTLVAKTQVSPTSSILTVGSLSSKSPFDSVNGLQRQAIVSIEAKQPQLQIARAYTPLPPLPGAAGAAGDEPVLRFFIRHDENGEMSGYLKRLLLGATIFLRGPNIELKLPGDVDKILFLAGGTGIAPALQVAYALSGSRDNCKMKPTMHVLWANKRKEDCMGGLSDTIRQKASWTNWRGFVSGVEPQKINEQVEIAPIVAELDHFKKSLGGDLKIDYFVDDEQTYITPEMLRLLTSSGQSNVESECAKPRGRGLILLSGSDGFISHFAGSKTWQNGEEVQGQLGGVLGNLAIQGWDVWKL